MRDNAAALVAVDKATRAPAGCNSGREEE